ncbi:MAG: O-antigen ligase family protein, partial [Gammaproteobacteria bacterium]|nr:O-antigen ligase family protein [Gammaproteobacteria bacterium]
LLGPKARIRIALAIMVIALVLTRSRMGNSAFFFSLAIAGVIVLLGLWWMSRKGKVSIHSVRPILILFISLIVIDLFIVGAWFGIDKVKDRIEQTSFATEIRDEVDIYAVNHLHAFLLTGSGGDTFAEVFPKFKSESFSGYIDHAHNDYLEFGSEFGLIGMALLSVIVVWSFIKSIQAQFIRRSYFMRGVGFSATMGVVAIMIHSAVDFNLQIPANAALFVILLAFGWLARYQRN